MPAVTLALLGLFTVVPAQADAMDELPVIGQLTPLAETRLAASRSGMLQDFPHAVSDPVSKGSALFKLNCAVERAQVKTFQAATVLAELALKSQQQLSEYESTTQLEVASAEAELERAKSELNIYQQILGQCTQTAPFSGVIGEYLVDPFEYVQEGDEILYFFDPNSLAFEFLAPADWSSQLSVGSTIDITFTQRRESNEFQVTTMAPMIDAIGQTVRVFATPTNPVEVWMRSGMVGQVTLR